MLDKLKSYFSRKLKIEVPNQKGDIYDNQTLLEGPIQGEKLKTILNEAFTSILSNLGLKWRGDYYWIGENKNGIRKVIHYFLLKGGRGVICWGITLDFLPLISGSNLVYSRSEKAVKLHLFEWPKGYKDSFRGIKMIDGNGNASHWGEEKAMKSATQAINGELENIRAWFEKVSTIEGVLKIAKEQSNNIDLERLNKEGYSDMYNLHYPSPKYVLTFLQAKSGNVEEAIRLFDSIELTSFDTSPKVVSKVRKLLQQQS